ncbi:ATP/GTP-binding protein [Streptomyces griseofuscus]|uniref:ATP/GTP-binding protein n=1 Tax=Streptomyces griseofuscus TaxID=146922 RepID=UPI00382492C0
MLPCYDPDLGSFSSGCYYKQIKDPTLIADMRKTATSAGQANGLAAYEMTCLLDGSSPGSVYVFLKNPPAKVVDPATLARQAVDKMLLEGPEVTSPRAGGKYVVGMPMWMWVDQTPTTYGPNRATASVGGVSVTATAVVSWISWAMGDGTAAVVCKGPGTKYTSSMGMARSPDCGHVYGRASVAEAGGKFHGTATATWSVDWRVAGVRAETGSFTEVRRSRFTAVVGEVQVLN